VDCHYRRTSWKELKENTRHTFHFFENKQNEIKNQEEEIDGSGRMRTITIAGSMVLLSNTLPITQFLQGKQPSGGLFGLSERGQREERRRQTQANKSSARGNRIPVD
jgi:hypothetical protein